MENKRRTAVLGVAIIAGVVAAGVAYLLHTRPHWRKYAVEAGRHLLNVADGVIHRSSTGSNRLK